MLIHKLNILIAIFLQKAWGASNKYKFPKSLKRLFYNMQFNYTRNYLIPYFNKAFSYLKNSKYTGINNKRIIWIFWWQGISNAPKITQKCIHSIINHSNGHKVIFIDRSNIKKYTSIPTYIYKKLDYGIIDFTHFSDIVRFNLLRKYGGLWIDSNMYCTSNLNKKYFNDCLYTSGGYQNTVPLFVAGRWVEGLIGGNKNNSMFQFMDNFNKLYWKNNNKLINYFMEDYAFYYIYNRNIGHFGTYINNEAYKNNPCLYKLRNLLNKPFDKKMYKRLLKETNLFSLTYKMKFIKSHDTFYNKLIINGNKK